jgi:hypothetical protein
MAAHKGPASLRPRCTRSGSSVAAIPIYQSTHYSLDRPGGFQGVEAVRFQDSRHVKVVRLSAEEHLHRGNLPNRKFHYGLQMTSPLDHILNQIDQVHTPYDTLLHYPFICT